MDIVWSLVFRCLVWFRCSGRTKVVCGGAPLAVDRKVVPGAWHRDIILVEVPVPVTEALRNAKELSLSFVNGPLRSGFGNRYRYR